MQRLPNVRKLFIPDPGFILVEADLVGADAMVMAWEAGGKYKSDFTSGVKMHVETMKYIYPEKYARGIAAYTANKDSKVFEPEDTKAKNMHYGTNYVGSPKGISAQAAIPLPLVQKFQPWHFAKYPEIKDVHRRIEMDVQTKREVWNAFGYRVHYFDRVDGLLPEAVNWKCQSTVAIICQRGKIILWKEFRDEVQILLDVHDSLIFQVRTRDAATILPAVRTRLDSIRVPYGDPLTIPWSFKWSDRSWGEATPIRWEALANAA